jgi:translation initiation factor 2 alpha subunit (eIF-2alpha)
LRVVKPDGVGIIREALTRGFSPTKGADIDISYLGSGRYLIKATSHDFKAAEAAMNAAADGIASFVSSRGGEASFQREAQ